MAARKPLPAVQPRRNAARKALTPKALLQLLALPALLLVVLLAAWFVFNIPLINQYRLARMERDKEFQKVRQIETEGGRLTEQERQFKRGLADERAIRGRYKMVKPGERLIVIEDKATEE